MSKLHGILVMVGPPSTGAYHPVRTAATDWVAANNAIGWPEVEGLAIGDDTYQGIWFHPRAGQMHLYCEPDNLAAHIADGWRRAGGPSIDETDAWRAEGASVRVPAGELTLSGEALQDVGFPPPISLLGQLSRVFDVPPELMVRQPPPARWRRVARWLSRDHETRPWSIPRTGWKTYAVLDLRSWLVGVNGWRGYINIHLGPVRLFVADWLDDWDDD